VTELSEPETAVMTAAELRAGRESLGLSPRQISEWVHTNERFVERVEIDDVSPTASDLSPEDLQERLRTYSDRVEELIAHTDAYVDRLEREARQRLKSSAEQVTLITFKNDADYQAWASRLARQIVKDLNIVRAASDRSRAVEDVEIAAEVLLMAGFTPGYVEEAVKSTLIRMTDGNVAVDSAQMQRFPMALPARWHRQVCARVVERVPEVAIAYAR
jgi:hypothetical protein